MKFTMDAGTLADTITAGISSLPTKPTTPIIGGVLFEARIGAVAVSSFNYDRATTRTAVADVADAGTAVVSGRLLATIGSNLPKDSAADVIVDGSEMLIRTGRTTFRLPLMIVEDYPQLPALDDGDVIGSVDCDDFAEAVRVIGGFASTDDAVPPITALNIVCESERLVLRATDRYIAARRRVSWNGDVASPVRVNVVADDLVSTIKAVHHGVVDQHVELLCNGALLGIRTASTTIVIRLFAEEFANIDRVMCVDSHSTAITVPTAVLVSMTKRAANIAEDQNSVIEVSVAATRRVGGHAAPTMGTLSIATAGKDAVGKFADSADITHHGADRSLKLSSRRLYAALAAISDENVTLAFQPNGHLVHLYPGAVEPDEFGACKPPDTDTVAMIMGVRS